MKDAVSKSIFHNRNFLVAIKYKEMEFIFDQGPHSQRILRLNIAPEKVKRISCIEETIFTKTDVRKLE